MKLFAEICDTIKAAGVLAKKMDGDNIAMILLTLDDKGLVPRKVTDSTIDTSAAKTCGEHNNMIVTLKELLHHFRQIVSLLSYFIYWNKERSQAAKVHQKVINKIFNLPIVMTTEHRAEGYAINGTKGMVTDKSTESGTWNWQIFKPFYINRNTQIVEHTLTEIAPLTFLT